MNLKKLALAAAAGTTLLAAAPAFAQSHWNQGYSRHAPYRHYHRPRVHYYAPAPVYYAPAPVYYAPPPYYYAPRSPVIYGRIPIGHHSSIGFSLPL